MKGILRFRLWGGGGLKGYVVFGDVGFGVTGLGWESSVALVF